MAIREMASPSNSEQWRQFHFNRGEPVFFDPRLTSLEELYKADIFTFSLLIGAVSLTHHLTQGGKIPTVALVGGLGVAAWKNEITRYHHDVDVIVPDTHLDRVLSHTNRRVNKGTYYKTSFDLTDIPFYRKLLNHFSFIDLRKMTITIDVDIFPYSRLGMHYNFSGKTGRVFLGLHYPVKPVKKYVFDLPLYAAPLEIIKKLKALDSRAIGTYDLSQLASV